MSGYIFRAVLRKADSEGIGAITIPFPIPDEEYADTVKLLTEAEVGDPILRDCYVEEMDSWWSSLKVLERQTVNENRRMGPPPQTSAAFAVGRGGAAE